MDRDRHEPRGACSGADSADGSALSRTTSSPIRPRACVRKRELTGQRRRRSQTTGDIRKGFVYERVPHVTLKSIAQNPDISEGMTREEIDAAIARHAETEILYDRPTRTRRSCGWRDRSPSRACRRTGCADDGAEDGDGRRAGAGRRTRRASSTMMLDNLRKAGVQNTGQGGAARPSTRSSAFAGRAIQAAGDYIEGGASKTGGGRHRSASTARSGPSWCARRPRRRPVRRPADRVRLRVRRARPRRSSAARQACRSLHGADEPRSADGRPAAEEDRRRQPVHGLRPARHRGPHARRRPAPGRDPRHRRLRPDHRRDPLRLDRRDRVAGSSTPTTTASRSSSATPTSAAAIEPYERLRQDAEGRHRRGGLGVALLGHVAPVPATRSARSPSRSSTTTATRS